MKLVTYNFKNDKNIPRISQHFCHTKANNLSIILLQLETPNPHSKKLGLHDSKINLDIVLSCLNMQDNNRYNMSIQFSIQYQDCSDKNINNLVLS